MSSLPIALYTAEQTRTLDRTAIETLPIEGYELMRRAGRAAFRDMLRCWPQASRIVVVCGAGNNGGDGYVMARLLHEAGREAVCLAATDPGQLQGAARQAADDARAAGVAVRPYDAAALEAADLIVDALLGTGLTRTVTGVFADIIDAMNAAPAPVLAVDIPSGLHADTGAIMGTAVRAARTVTFIGMKRGLLTGEGPALCGALCFEGLDLPPAVYDVVAPTAVRITDDLPQRCLPPRPRSAHKGHHGHVLVIGGGAGMAGAVRMAAEAAARVGAGLVSVATQPAHAALVNIGRPELMCHGVGGAEDLRPLLARASVVAIGPGLGQASWSRAMTEAAFAADKPLVVDADALNLLAQMQIRTPRKRDDWILTPHPGEAGRLLERSTAAVQADRFEAVRALAVRYGGVCVLKGAGTLVAGPAAEPVRVCTAGNPGMASGGMGDVLTGVLAGLLAQGVPPLKAAAAGVLLHGRAGDRAAAEGGERGLLATDLLPHLRRLVNPT